MLYTATSKDKTEAAKSSVNVLNLWRCCLGDFDETLGSALITRPDGGKSLYGVTGVFGVCGVEGITVLGIIGTGTSKNSS